MPPRSSVGRPWARDSRSVRLANQSAAQPTGTLTRKIGRQPSPAMSACISAPPTNWAAIEARPSVVPK